MIMICLVLPDLVRIARFCHPVLFRFRSEFGVRPAGSRAESTTRGVRSRPGGSRETRGRDQRRRLSSLGNSPLVHLRAVLRETNSLLRPGASIPVAKSLDTGVSSVRPLARRCASSLSPARRRRFRRRDTLPLLVRRRFEFTSSPRRF